MRVRVLLILLILTSLLFSQSPFYGVQTHFGQFRRGDMDSLSMELQLDLVKSAGIEMIRDECLWSDVETDSGHYAIPPEIDRYVRAAAARDIDIYMILNYNNTFYAPSTGSGITTSENREAYARYCNFVVDHFAPLGVRHYEIWNEPNHGVLFWTPQPDANDYAALLETAYTAIKSIDSSLIVIGCATSPAIGNPPPYVEGLDFIRDVFSAGGGYFMDAVSFHLYQVAYRPEYEFLSYVNSVKSYAGDMPIFFSEFGYPTHTAWPNITLEKQARYVTRMYLICAADPQIQAVVHYDLKNDGTVAEEPEHNFGLLQFNRTPKPAYTALKKLILDTDARRPVSFRSGDDIFISEISDSLQIAWAYSGEQTTVLNVHSNYLRIEDITGDTIGYHITANDTIILQIKEDPVYCFAQNDEPLINTFMFKDKAFLLYPDETMLCTYSAIMEDGCPVTIDPSAVSWTFMGDCGTIDEDIFTASTPGNGSIVANIQGLTDTIAIRVIEDPGFHTVESFSDTIGFFWESTYLDTETTAILQIEEDDRDALKLTYEYSGSSAVAYLHKNILINHHADSIFMDFKTDDKEYEFRLYCKDGDGISHTLGLRPRPTDWNDTWGTLGGPMSIDASVTPPVYVEKIYIKLKPGDTQQTAPYSGEVVFDDLRIKKGLTVNIAEENAIADNFYLSQNYPNPFNENTRIHFILPHESRVILEIFDLKGNCVDKPLDKVLSSGDHYYDLRINDAPTGLYIYRLSANNIRTSKKLLYLK